MLFSSLLILRSVMKCEMDLPLPPTPSCPGSPYSAAVVQVWAAPTGRRQVPRGVLHEDYLSFYPLLLIMHRPFESQQIKGSDKIDLGNRHVRPT